MMKKFRLYLLVSVLFLAGLVGIAHKAFAISKDRYSDLQLFTKVLNLIEQYYVEDVDTKKLIYGGIKGMLASLEPHSSFLPPDIFKEFETETNGEFSGIGVEITLQNDVLTVISPIEDTPAWKAGLKSGDKIVEIDGKSTKGASVAEAMAKIRGKGGTPVKLTIWREGFEKPRTFVVERDTIKVKSVKYTDLGDGYGYFKITSFIKFTSANLADAISNHEKKYGKIKGVIIDLRNNAGGLLDQAIQVCNQFISDGVIVSTIGRNKKIKEVVTAKKDGARTDFPLIVLMNEYSASASEIVAGALKDHKRAIVMGSRSFGKGSVQSVIELGDGAGLKLTVARYYTPSGRSIQAEGIEPDIKLDSVDPDAYEKAIVAKKSLREADIDGHLVNENDKKQVADNKNEKDKDDEESGDEFWKADKSKDAEKTAKKKAADEAKLSPSERLLKKDFQVAQAFNYMKAWTMFREVGNPFPDVKKPIVMDAAVDKPADENKASDLPADVEKKPSKKAKKKGGSGQAVPSARKPNEIK